MSVFFTTLNLVSSVSYEQICVAFPSCVRDWSAVPSDLVEKLATGDYSGADDILIKYGQDNGYSNRRNDEAKLLQELSKQKNSTAN